MVCEFNFLELLKHIYIEDKNGLAFFTDSSIEP